MDGLRNVQVKSAFPFSGIHLSQHSRTTGDPNSWTRCLSDCLSSHLSRHDGEPGVSFLNPRECFKQDPLTPSQVALCEARRHRSRRISTLFPRRSNLSSSPKQEILASVRLDEIEAEDSLKLSHLFRDKSETQVAKRIWL